MKGLTCIRDFISKEKHDELLKFIDLQEWSNDLSRRTQHYGYKYDYRARMIDESMKVGDIPKELNLFEGFDQLIINEYESGQGISKHIDCVPCFDERIVSLSLGSSCIMEFAKKKEFYPLFLEPMTFLELRDEARYEWTHAIPARKRDVYKDKIILRGRRVSLTYRKVLK